jgi:hypothetical protein
MTDDEIRDIFIELRHIGADVGQPPGLALGTGFRDGEFLEWLRSLPEGLGHEEFVARLGDRVNEAEPNVELPPPIGDSGRPHREWPTIEQMHAGMDVLIREWDPLGARLGELGTEEVAHHAYNGLRMALSGQPSSTVERQISQLLGAVEEEVFGVRRSPREQRRYLARRLMRVVADNPGPPHEEDAWEEFSRAIQASTRVARAQGRVKVTRRGMQVALGPRGAEPPALDLAAVCTECGATGTVAVVMREVEPRVSRYCLSCWSLVRDRYLSWVLGPRRPKEEDDVTPEELIAGLDRFRDHLLFEARERVRHVASAMWEDTLLFKLATKPVSDDDRAPADQERHLEQLAREIVQQAPRMYGPMPPEIAAIVDQYGPPDA